MGGAGRGAKRSYAAGGSDPPLVGTTVGELLEDAAGRWPDSDAVVSLQQGVRLTWRELAEQVDRLACGLIGEGVGAGHRVGVLAPNRVEWLVAQYAVASIGAVLVGVNPAHRVDEVRYVLDHSGASIVLAAQTFRTSDYREILGRARRDLTTLRTVVHFETPEWDALAAGGADPDRAARALAELRAGVGFDDVAVLQYTSGTTGRPKGAALTHHNLVNNARIVPPTLGWKTNGERLCVPVGYFHIFGITLGSLAAAATGTTIVLPSPSFDPAATLRAIQDERCTSMLAVPTMYVALLDHPDRPGTDLTSMRSGIVGGSSVPAALFHRAVEDLHLPDLQVGYGMTETAPASVHTSVEHPVDRRATTIGRPLAHTEAQIVDPTTGRTQPPDTPGELCIRGYLVMHGYWADADATAAVIDDHGWMHTGDLASMDEDGYVRIVGRIKDLIIRAGENVASAEVEAVLAGHPAVRDAHVVGVPHPALGEEVFAWIRLRPGATLAEDEVRAWCVDRIAHFKIPRYVRLIEDVPTTASGKVRKVELRAWAAREVAAAGAQARS